MQTLNKLITVSLVLTFLMNLYQANLKYLPESETIRFFPDLNGQAESFSLSDENFKVHPTFTSSDSEDVITKTFIVSYVPEKTGWLVMRGEYGDMQDLDKFCDIGDDYILYLSKDKTNIIGRVSFDQPGNADDNFLKDGFLKAMESPPDYVSDLNTQIDARFVLTEWFYKLKPDEALSGLVSNVEITKEVKKDDSDFSYENNTISFRDFFKNEENNELQLTFIDFMVDQFKKSNSISTPFSNEGELDNSEIFDDFLYESNLTDLLKTQTLKYFKELGDKIPDFNQNNFLNWFNDFIKNYDLNIAFIDKFTMVPETEDLDYLVPMFEDKSDGRAFKYLVTIKENIANYYYLLMQKTNKTTKIFDIQSIIDEIKNLDLKKKIINQEKKKEIYIKILEKKVNIFFDPLWMQIYYYLNKIKGLNDFLFNYNLEFLKKQSIVKELFPYKHDDFQLNSYKMHSMRRAVLFEYSRIPEDELNKGHMISINLLENARRTNRNLLMV